MSPLAPKKVALVHVAKRQLRLTERDYRALLSRAGVNRASELSEQSFHAVMDELTLLGFRARNGFGHRPGFASPSQVAVMRKLWRELHQNSEGEAALNAWLDRFHRVSALRFVTAEKAGSVLTALKAMVVRKRKGR